MKQYFTSVAFAADTPVPAVAKQPSMLESMIPFGFILIIMYFLIIRPQAKKAKEHTSLLDSLKPGEEIVTSGGIIGKVKSVSPDFITIDVGSTTLKVVKDSITRKTIIADKAVEKTPKS